MTSGTIDNVSDTAFWVAHYRAQESQRDDAILNDAFAARLAGERGKRIAESMSDISRYTEWSVVSRTVIIDRFITEMLACGVDAVINLGAGLDARPYRMALPPELLWIEVDYPHIIAYKKSTLEGEVPRCRLEQVPLDLSDTIARQNFLQSAALDSKRVLILTEGVIPYLSPAQVGELGRELREQQRFGFWITEYFHPRVYKYLKDTVRMAKMKAAPFLFYPDDWYGFFRNLGWKTRQTKYSGDIATEFKRRLPMPKLASILFAVMPRRLREQAGRMSGHVLFERAP